MDPIALMKFVGFVVGIAMVIVGAVCDLMAAIGLLRFRNFFLRMHAATIGIVGGAVVPLIGIALISLATGILGSSTISFACICIATAVFILVVAPIGTHVLANAAYHTSHPKPEPLIHDSLKKRSGGE